MASDFSSECIETLRLLSGSKNVLISGPPGTGKSRLLGEVALAFSQGLGSATASSTPRHNPSAPVPIPPARAPIDPALAQAMPSAAKADRRVFRTVFHQNSKNRDFTTGMTPSVVKTAGGADFRIVHGTLFKASEHAKTNDGASLLVIDEINRGPAVQVFGGSIVAIEADKRLAPDGSRRTETQWFDITNPVDGEMIEYALPHDLYILAAMNQADASVEPLDVAFLRRWEPLRLLPSTSVLRNYYGVVAGAVHLFEEPPTLVQPLYEASVQAWETVNQQISLGRGPEFQIGHGVLMSYADPKSMDLDTAKLFVCMGWEKVRTHIEEVFFGDVRGVAATLNALGGPGFNPFKLVETTFAGDLRYKLEGPSTLTPEVIYDALRAIAMNRE